MNINNPWLGNRNRFDPTLPLSQTLALQLAAHERGVPVVGATTEEVDVRPTAKIKKRRNAETLVPPRGVPPLEFEGNPGLPDWGLGGFSRKALKHLLEWRGVDADLDA